MVEPDGPAKCNIAYLGESPGEEEEIKKLGFTGYAGSKLWGMAGAEGLPYRRSKGGFAFGPCVSDSGDTAWVGNVMRERPRVELKGSEIDKQLRKWLPSLKKDLPKAKVYITVGDLATRALVSGALPTTRRANYKSVMRHASSVVSAAEAKGLLKLPPGSFAIPIRHTAALLRGSDEWYPSCKQGLNRAARLLGLAPQGKLPKPPPQQFFLEATQIEEPIAAALQVGAYSIDIETPIVQHIPETLYIGSVSVGSRVWVFGAADFLRLCARLFGSSALCIGQNIATFDLPVLQKCGLPFPAGGIFDTRWIDALLRPRMPHELAHMAAHLLPWGPFNWKWEAENVYATSLPGRRYCAKDSWFTWFIAKFQQKELKARGLGKAASIRTKMLPVISNVAVEGVRVDRTVRRKLRLELTQAIEDLTLEVQGYLQEWAAGEVSLLEAQLGAFQRELKTLRDSSFKKKGAALRPKGLSKTEDDALITKLKDKAKDLNKEKVQPLKRRIERLTNVRPSQTEVLGEFLFTNPRGLNLKPAGRTKTGKPKVGREDLEKVSRRSDVFDMLASGDERPKVLLRIADANRISGELGTHLGVLMDKKTKKYDLANDAQLRQDGRLSIIFNPVRKRFSAGQGQSDKPVASSYQSHNIPSTITVVIKGAQKTWNLREQIIPDRDDQFLGTADWKKMEQFIMAWQAGSRIGYWDWLKDLYAGVDTHAQMAAEIGRTYSGLKGCPSTTKGAKEFKIQIGGREWTAYKVGKQTNHAMTLGATWRMLHTRMDVPVKDAKSLEAAFYRSERGMAIKELHAHIQAEVVADRRVMTPFGEPVDFWGLAYDGKKVSVKDPKGPYSVAQQDTAAIMMMRCLPEVDNAARRGGGRFLVQAHDEFVYCGDLGKESVINKAVKATMEREWPELPVPFTGKGLSIPVDINTGGSWGEAK